MQSGSDYGRNAGCQGVVADGLHLAQAQDQRFNFFVVKHHRWQGRVLGQRIAAARCPVDDRAHAPQAFDVAVKRAQGNAGVIGKPLRRYRRAVIAERLHERHEPDDAVWPLIRDTYFGMIPRPIRGFVTNKIRKPQVASLHKMGIGRSQIC